VGIVAFGTGGLADQDGVDGEQMDFRPLGLVASEANVGLADFFQHLILGRMGGVTVAAGHALHFMLASTPVCAQTAFVAAYAFIILGNGRCRFIGFVFCAINDVRGRPSLLVRVAFQVGITLTVALLARWGAGIGPVSVR